VSNGGLESGSGPPRKALSGGSGVEMPGTSCTDKVFVEPSCEATGTCGAMPWRGVARSAVAEIFSFPARASSDRLANEHVDPYRARITR
jgi:hypothetical protein